MNVNVLSFCVYINGITHFIICTRLFYKLIESGVVAIICCCMNKCPQLGRQGVETRVYFTMLLKTGRNSLARFVCWITNRGWRFHSNPNPWIGYLHLHNYSFTLIFNGKNADFLVLTSKLMLKSSPLSLNKIITKLAPRHNANTK